jgi:hypothetical protein
LTHYNKETAIEQSSGRVPHLIRFSLRSLFTEYGPGFLFGILLGRSIKAIKGMAAYAKKNIDSSDLSRGKTLVGLGFCLKPLQPACPSERAHHDSRYLDEALHLNPKAAPKVCRGCAIRKIATEAPAAGCDLYIMTSARDILHDLLKPAVEKPCFHRALLALCRYSIEPFRLAGSVSKSPCFRLRKGTAGPSASGAARIWAASPTEPASRKRMKRNSCG